MDFTCCFIKNLLRQGKRSEYIIIIFLRIKNSFFHNQQQQFIISSCKIFVSQFNEIPEPMFNNIPLLLFVCKIEKYVFWTHSQQGVGGSVNFRGIFSQPRKICSQATSCRPSLKMSCIRTKEPSSGCRTKICVNSCGGSSSHWNESEWVNFKLGPERRLAPVVCRVRWWGRLRPTSAASPQSWLFGWSS